MIRGPPTVQKIPSTFAELGIGLLQELADADIWFNMARKLWQQRGHDVKLLKSFRVLCQQIDSANQSESLQYSLECPYLLWTSVERAVLLLVTRPNEVQ